MNVTIKDTINEINKTIQEGYLLRIDILKNLNLLNKDLELKNNYLSRLLQQSKLEPADMEKIEKLYNYTISSEETIAVLQEDENKIVEQEISLKKGIDKLIELEKIFKENLLKLKPETLQ